MIRRYRWPVNKGVTLIELVITIVIMSVAMLAVVSVYLRAMSTSVNPMIYAKSVELAQAYLDEILTKKYDENTPSGGVPPVSGAGLSATLGPDTGETRATYDDVDDYDGLSDSVPVFITGDNFTEYVNYQVDVTVDYVDASVELSGLGLADEEAKRIQVDISNPLGVSLTLSAYRGNF